MPVVDLLGHPTWCEQVGEGDETVLLLHGGLSNSDALLDGVGRPLAASRRVAAFDRRGHGRTADTPEPFHYDSMVDETIAFIEHVGAPVHVVGWSDGGIVGLLLALRRPDLIGRLVLIGTNYHWDVTPESDADPQPKESPGPDDVPMDDPNIARMAAAYAERSPDGAAHFPVVAAKGFRLFANEPELTVEEVAEVSVPVLVMAGDRDVIPLAHTASLFAALRDAQLAILPGASHWLPMEQPREVAAVIDRFFDAATRQE